MGWTGRKSENDDKRDNEHDNDNDNDNENEHEKNIPQAPAPPSHWQSAHILPMLRMMTSTPALTPAKAALRLDNVACRRGGRLLFTGLSLALAPGDAAQIAGPNGIGKSSLLRLIAGLVPRFHGTIEIEGGLALADESLALDPLDPLEQALGYWARLDGGMVRLANAMATMGIDHLAPVPVRMLSTGQRKRAVLARTIASGAGLWLLDEPGNGLDRDGLERLERAVAAHRAQGGIILIASHFQINLPHAQLVTVA